MRTAEPPTMIVSGWGSSSMATASIDRDACDPRCPCSVHCPEMRDLARPQAAQCQDDIERADCGDDAAAIARPRCCAGRSPSGPMTLPAAEPERRRCRRAAGPRDSRPARRPAVSGAAEEKQNIKALPWPGFSAWTSPKPMSMPDTNASRLTNNSAKRRDSRPSSRS